MKLKKGDLVKDKDGDLCLVITNDNRDLVLITLNLCHYHSATYDSVEAFLSYNNRHDIKVLGNVATAFTELKNEIPK